MWHLVFPMDDGGVAMSCTESFDTLEEGLVLRDQMAAVHGNHYALIDAPTQTDLLRRLNCKSLPDLIASGEVPAPHFRMLKDGEDDDWTDPWVLEQLGRSK